MDLVEGDAQAALGSLRRAFEVWYGIEAPTPLRVLIGLVCRALGDEASIGVVLLHVMWSRTPAGATVLA